MSRLPIMNIKLYYHHTYLKRVLYSPLPVCPFVRPSVCYAISPLTIGRNPTKFSLVENKNDLELDFKFFFFTDSYC